MREVKNSVIAVIIPEGEDAAKDIIMPLKDLSLEFDASSEDILAVVQPMILEKYGVNIKDENDSWLYKVVKAVDNKNVNIIPNSTAG